MDLAASWRAAAADEALRRAFLADGFDDSAWEPVRVPGHWQSVARFADSDGPLLYRHSFSAPAPAEGRRGWLTFDGVFYDGDVWLDGTYVGATEGYFFPHTFEITALLRAEEEHVLAVEVGCAPPGDRTAKRALTGVFQDWDCLDGRFNPGGIWRPVRITETGPVRLSRLRVLCAEATAERAALDIRAVLDAVEPATVGLVTTVRRSDGTVVDQRRSSQTLAQGENRIRLQRAIDDPELWWPHSLGDQPLHTVEVEVLVSPDPAGSRRGRRGAQEASAEELSEYVPSDAASVVTGLRQVRMNNWVLTVNGERLFLKGSNHGPTRAAIADATSSEVEADVVQARAAGLDLLRIHGHVGRPELYDAADRHGMLLWQDLPLEGRYSRSVRRQAVRQAREAVDLLGHHPSIALWCGHALFEGSVAVNAVRQELPTWNKTVLDSSIGRALERADPTRPVVRHSGQWPGLVTTGTDAHLYLGWKRGAIEDLPRLLSSVPRMASFVTEFGAPSVPLDVTADPGRWDHYVPRGAYETYEAWRVATEEYQASVIRAYVETLRGLKYRPAGGFCQYMWADAAPGATFSVLDHRRRPSLGYHALVDACAPVIVMASPVELSYARGAPLELAVHVVSDLRVPLDRARVVASYGSSQWGFEGSVDADSCQFVGTIRSVASESGTLTLSLTCGDVQASRRYTITVR